MLRFEVVKKRKKHISQSIIIYIHDHANILILEDRFWKPDLTEAEVAEHCAILWMQ